MRNFITIIIILGILIANNLYSNNNDTVMLQMKTYNIEKFFCNFYLEDL